MNTIRHADLLQLINSPGDRFVSLYMPTYPAGRETPQNPIRFRELLKTANDLLGKKGCLRVRHPRLFRRQQHNSLIVRCSGMQ